MIHSDYPSLINNLFFYFISLNFFVLERVQCSSTICVRPKQKVSLHYFCLIAFFLSIALQFCFPYAVARLSLLARFISESYIEIGIGKRFYFHTSLWCLKRFYEDKALIKPFEAPQIGVKIKI